MSSYNFKRVALHCFDKRPVDARQQEGRGGRTGSCGSMQTLCAVGRYPQWCSASGQRYPAEMEEVEGLMEGWRGKVRGKQDGC